MTDRTPEADRLLHYMPIVVRSVHVTEWERRFCASMIAQERRGRFCPSGAQMAHMSRIVAHFQNATLRDGADGR